MEWVEHRFTPDHLRKLKEVMDAKIGGEGALKMPPLGWVMFVFVFVDGAAIEEALELDLEPLLEESLQTEHDNPVLELSDDMSNFQNRIPAYVRTRAISKESLKPSSGFLCELCNRFFPSEEVAQVSAHSF